MFRLENASYLYLLWTLPLWLLAFYAYIRWRQKSLATIGEPSVVSRLLPDFSFYRQRQKFICFLIAFAALSIALANPQLGTKIQKVKHQGIDVIVALDVSKSMLAEDLQPNRLERAKQLVYKLLTNMHDNQVGIIVFAGNAYLQMPLTSDYAAAKLFLQSINTDMIPTQGTALADAIELAKNAFNTTEKKHKALLLISDGEDHEAGASDAAASAAKEGIAIFALGIGSLEGAPVPVYVNGKKSGIKRDNDGNIIHSKMNPDALRAIAKAANGDFFHLQGAASEVNDVTAALDKIEKKDFAERSFSDYDHKFFYFIALAILALAVSWLLPLRQKTLPA